jgi:NodT family efflux transporter outer membrane factor (OMF) lipoprotein
MRMAALRVSALRVSALSVHRARLLIAAVLLAAGGCNLAPHYEPPKPQKSEGYKEAVPGGDGAAQGWKLAEPQDAAIRNNWWEVYQDPKLNELEERVAISNQTIAAAEANYRAAHALVLEAQAALFPTFSLVPSATREKSSAALSGIGGVTTTGTGTTGASVPTGSITAPRNIFTLPLEASYQVDLWGSIRNTVAANRFSAQASAATLANALLSTQSTLAQDYFQLRVADEQRRILETTVADYQASLHLVQTLFNNGLDSDEDVASAETQLDSAIAQATDVGVARAQFEHAIAVLIGVPPAKFSIAYQHFDQPLPVIPVGVPSDLLERRPDIAAAERQVAQSNAQIGVARAAFFPQLTLTGSIGYESTQLSHLIEAPNRFWSVGPSLAQILFDGGERRAAVLQAHAQNDAQAATYRQTVLAAFQSVEDNLAALRILSQELVQQHEAAMAAKRFVQLSVVRFRNGVDSYVNVITAENTFLTAREAELQVKLRQLTASAGLINDLGGGWSVSQLGETERMAAHPPDAGQEPKIPAGEAGSLANPPPMPASEIQPDDFIKLNDEAMTPPPRGAADQQ